MAEEKEPPHKLECLNCGATLELDDGLTPVGTPLEAQQAPPNTTCSKCGGCWFSSSVRRNTRETAPQRVAKCAKRPRLARGFLFAPC